MFFKRVRLGRGGGAAPAEQPKRTTACAGTDADLEAEIARLSREARALRAPESDRPS